FGRAAAQREHGATVLKHLDRSAYEEVGALVVFAFLEQQAAERQLAKRRLARARVQVFPLHAVERREIAQQAKVDRLAFHESPTIRIDCEPVLSSRANDGSTHVPRPTGGKMRCFPRFPEQ